MTVRHGPVALVTGANKGIGKEIARGLASRGMTTFLGCRDPLRGELAARELGSAGTVVPVRLDVREHSAVEAVAGRLADEFGRLDVLVNNAGINRGSATPSEVTAADLREVYETNVIGVIVITNALLPLLRRASAARVVNISSYLGSLEVASAPDNPYHSLLAYHSSKAALNMITVHYSRELRDTPIKVNAVCPGRCATDLNDCTGERTPAQGAAIAIRFATLDDSGPTGGFFNDDGRIAW